MLLKYILLLKQLYYNIFLFFSLFSSNLIRYGRSHLNYSPTVMFPGKPCNCHVYRYLEYAQDIICDFLKSGSVSEVLFVPYALRDQVKG